MNNTIFIMALLFFVFGSCATPAYLPSTDKIDVNEHGSYIFVKTTYKTNIDIKGELIAVDSNEIIVLINEWNLCMTVPISAVKRFTLRYAEPKGYAWSIPVFTLLSTTHGFMAIYSAPVNIIATTIVTLSAENDFKYTDKNMTYRDLKMFARFPQGLPPGVSLDSIK